MSHSTGPVPELRLFDGLRESPRRLHKLSVLMPVYNERWTLAEIVRQVLDAPVDLELELVAVDDGSSDGSGDLLLRLADDDARIKVFRHRDNRGKGAALRTALARMTGDVAVVQDADLEYDPRDFPRMLAPLLADEADAVFGTRFAGHPRRVLPWRHRLVNQALTLASNLLTNLSLTDMETCYKMVRADVLKQLRLRSHSFTFEPELTCRLAQWGARICEVPIRYEGRSEAEGKKIRASDGLKALATLVRCAWLDPEFTQDRDLFQAARSGPSVTHAKALAQSIARYCGSRLLEVGAARGTLSAHFASREQLSLFDPHPRFQAHLKQRFGRRTNVRVAVDSTELGRWNGTDLQDTLVCGDLTRLWAVAETALADCARSLRDGGHAVLIVPGGNDWLLDEPGQQRGLGESRDMDAQLAAAGLERMESFRVVSWRNRSAVLQGTGTAAPGFGSRLLGMLEPLAELMPGVEASVVLVARRRSPASVISRAA